MNKIIYLFISLFLITNYIKAQKASIGLTAGATFSSYKIKAGSLSVTSKTKVGLTAGVASFINMGKNFSFQPNLNFTQKGGTLKEEGMTEKTTFNYLELPLNFVYNTHSAKGKFFVGAGPSVSIGLSGKDKWNDGEESGKDDINFGSGDDDNLKAIDAGINFLAGYKFNGDFFIAANYYAGLSNLAVTSGGDDGKMNNRYFGIRIGYLFNSKTKQASL
jgi:hypothetical protein